MAAGRPSIADRLAFVVAFGGHGDFQRVVRYLCTGLEPDPAGLDSRRAADGRPAPQPPSIHRPPHDYGVAVMALDLAAEWTGRPGRSAAQAILVFLEASHLALYDAEVRHVSSRGPALEVTLHEPAATYLRLVNAGTSRLSARACSRLSRRSATTRRSHPSDRPLRMRPSSCCTATDDNVIPAVESRFLARSPRRQGPGPPAAQPPDHPRRGQQGR